MASGSLGKMYSYYILLDTVNCII